MKYTNKQYANSLLSALDGKSANEQPAMIKRFLALLRKNGDSAKRSQILRETERGYFRASGMSRVEVEVAGKSLAAETLRKDIEEAVGRKIVMSEKVNPAMIGGIKILIDDETLIDASALSRLNKIFTRTH
ncbi:MAG: hypothetical protein A3B23_01595 [Candidatus Colwellbacteria bacterium RIFCSPLOWO2_01_FULL_48_10]|uniref:Uncharacterized protein n=2 Tax=Bacteria candidate phyla TaxID=1783234 RepID=A0A1F5P0G6_9BACT|nr:MAG: hypothetical protein A2846_05175 [Candidatus Doudnabacteria bacterium RIFCSPHIGHO2_01_FULL_49_9]OGY60366.1 MAG: hypothetical protein A3B23_01595 [Candidatus Colwellbacteria bacterium RIFCSPLOWO2_01_FULL_48_10]